MSVHTTLILKLNNNLFRAVLWLVEYTNQNGIIFRKVKNERCS